MSKIASARKNGTLGYKAVINYIDGRSHIPARKNFATREEAVAYAQHWIDANDGRPAGVRSQKINVMAPSGGPAKNADEAIEAMAKCDYWNGRKSLSAEDVK